MWRRDFWSVAPTWRLTGFTARRSPWAMMGLLPRGWRLQRWRLSRRVRRRRSGLSLHDAIAVKAKANPLAAPPPQCPPGVYVRTISGRGRALLAARPFRAGETILAERPLVAVPMPGPEADLGSALTCESCHCFMGSAQLHRDLTAGQVGPAAARAAAVRRGCSCDQCGALYCGTTCREAARRRGHALLCASGPARSAWRAFRRHAREDAELPELELAATLLAAILARQPRSLQHTQAEVAEEAAAAKAAEAAAVALGFVQESVARVLRRDAAGAAAAALTLREVRRSCALCRRAL